METSYQVPIYDHETGGKNLCTVKFRFEVGPRLTSCRSCTGVIYEYFHLMTFFKYYDKDKHNTQV